MDALIAAVGVREEKEWSERMRNEMDLLIPSCHCNVFGEVEYPLACDIGKKGESVI